MNNKTKISKTLNYLIRIAIIAATYGFIYRQVFYDRDLDQLFQELAETFEGNRFWLTMLLMVLLMLVNWGLETRKWQILIGKIEKVSFPRCYKAVLTGVSVSMFTPNRVGDYFGRVFILKKGSHIQGILVTIIGSISQFLVTLIAGLLSVLLFIFLYGTLDYDPGRYIYYLTGIGIPLLILFLLIAYFKIPALASWLTAKWKIMAEKFRDYTAVFSWYNYSELSKILVLSSVRYLVFSSQFYLMLRLFGVPLPMGSGFMIISLIYLTITIVPTVALTELGIRGSISIFLIYTYFGSVHGKGGDYELAVFAASTFTWLINLVVPALLGTFFVFNLKFFRR